jgi:hypothetical protein
LRKLILASLAVAGISVAGRGGDFQVLFEGHGDISSYIYFKQDSKYFIDTELNGAVETFGYRKFYLTVDLFKETFMGRKYNSNMVFDPTRAHWSFGLTGRVEFERYVLEAQLHHDCSHDIDRFDYNSVYWNSPRIGFGSIEYLPKYRYHQPQPSSDKSIWENKLDYYVLAGFYAPRGINFQKNHDYEFTLNTNFRWRILRRGRIGGDIEFDNLWVLNSDRETKILRRIKRQHRLSFNTTIYGDKGALVIFLRFWPYDDQSIRSRREHKLAFGMHLGF